MKHLVFASLLVAGQLAAAFPAAFKPQPRPDPRPVCDLQQGRGHDRADGARRFDHDPVRGR